MQAIQRDHSDDEVCSNTSDSTPENEFDWNPMNDLDDSDSDQTSSDLADDSDSDPRIREGDPVGENDINRCNSSVSIRDSEIRA